MNLNTLFPSCPNLEIEALTADSRENVTRGLFFCLKGLVHDGHRFVDQAIENGAIAIVHSDPIEHKEGIIYHCVSDVLSTLNESAKVFYHDPASHLTLFGVTGTNGKSTIAKTIKEIYSSYVSTGYSGTISIEYADQKEKPDFTTPETIPMMKLLNRMIDHSVKAAALEISSQGLDQGRADALHFDVSIFTNLTHDHLDYHGDLENYYLAKKHLFDLTKESGCSIINIDDPYGKRLTQELKTRVYSYSILEQADYYAKDIKYHATNTQFTLVVQGKEYSLQTNFVAAFNLSNLLAIIAACHQAHMPLVDILNHVTSLPLVEGRMTVIQEGQAFNCIVDYAHTPDGFEKIYAFAKTITKPNHKIISVFGAAGKRDTKKRAILGEISDRYCTNIILTEEDPRTESALEIAQQIESAIHHANTVIILDRYDAIRQAIELANADDTILILAKGNELYLAKAYGKEPWIGDENCAKEIIQTLLKERKNELR